MPLIDATMSSTCRVSATWCDAEHPRAVPRRHGRRGQRAGHALGGREVERLADEVLVRQRDEHRPPGRDQLVEPAGQLQRVVGVLAEVVRRVDQDRSRGTPERHRPLGQAGHGGDHVGHHVVVLHPVRVGPRPEPAGVAAHESDAELRRHLGHVRVRPRPGVVEQVCAAMAQLPSNLRTPGVDADHELRVRRPDALDEGRRTAQLLGGVDVVAVARLDPTDVDDVGALARRRPRPGRSQPPRRRCCRCRRTSRASGSRSPSRPTSPYRSRVVPAAWALLLGSP